MNRYGYVHVVVAVFLLVTLFAGCTGTSAQSDEPTKVTFIYMDKKIEPVIGLNQWNGAKYDREDTIISFMNSRSTDDLLYIENGGMIGVDFAGLAPDRISLQAYSMDEEGRAIGTVQEMSFVVVNEAYFFPVEADKFMDLSSESSVTGPIDCFAYKLTCRWGDNDCEYGFAIRGDGVRDEFDEEKLLQSLNDLTRENEAYMARLQELEAALTENKTILHKDSAWFIKDWVGEDYSIITQDLKSRPEIIEMKAVLGGTMMFVQTDLLTDRLAFGAFEDGHIAGTGIYEYYMDDEGMLQWSVVEEFPDGEFYWRSDIDQEDAWSVWQAQLYKARTLEDVIALYREDIDASYAEGYGSRLIKFYDKLGPAEFVDVLYKSDHAHIKNIEQLLIMQVGIYGDLFDMSLDTLEKDMRDLLDPYKDIFVTDFADYVEAMDAVIE